MDESLARRLASAPSTRVALLTAILFGLTASIDLLTGPELSFSVFYLLPIAVTAVRWGKTPGHALAFLAAAVWLSIGLWSGPEYSHPAIPYWNALIRLGFFSIVVSLFGRLADAVHHAEALARTDPLTGLPNRRHFEELAVHEFDRVDRLGTPLALAIIDVDDFKGINDRHGHTVGDEVLRRVGDVARGQLRAVDIAARIGGDEFAILLPDTAHKDVNRVLERFAAVLASGDRIPSVACSIGVVHVSGSPLAEALRAADKALYRAKDRGKGRIEIAEHSPASISVETA